MAAKATTYTGAPESVAHMSASTEASGVSSPTSSAVRSKRVNGQSPGESGRRGQNDNRLT
jgi:hypothetical protein